MWIITGVSESSNIVYDASSKRTEGGDILVFFKKKIAEWKVYEKKKSPDLEAFL